MILLKRYINLIYAEKISRDSSYLNFQFILYIYTIEDLKWEKIEFKYVCGRHITHRQYTSWK